MSQFPTTLAEITTEIDRSWRLRMVCEPLFAQVTALVNRSRELCRVHRHIAGGSDLESPFIVEIVATSPMCADCLAKKTGIPLARTRDALRRVRGFMAVTAATACCRACLEVTTVYRLSDGTGVSAAPSDAAAIRPALTTQSEALWRFLRSRRGEMFCTQCIATALSATKRIDRSVLGAEGRGAHRQYGKCAACSKERLLCGLMR